MGTTQRYRHSHRGRWACWRSVVFGLLLLGAATWSPSARAQSAAAEALFREAQRLASEQKYAEACPKFQASLELDRQLGTMLNLADCLEKVGELASAWDLWGKALWWARQRQDPRVVYIEGRRQAVEKRLPRLTVVVDHPVDTLAVRRGDVPVPPGSYGVALPVNPGPHSVIVMRGDQQLEARAVDAVEAQTVVVKLDLAAIDGAHPVAAPAAPTASATSTAPGPTSGGQPDELPTDDGQTQRTVGWIVGGVGAAALLTAVVLEIVALVKKDQADREDSCVNKFCSPQGLEAAESAKTYAEVGQWLGIGGLATLAVGVTILLTAPSGPAEPATAGGARVVPWVLPGSAGIIVQGSL